MSKFMFFPLFFILNYGNHDEMIGDKINHVLTVETNLCAHFIEEKSKRFQNGNYGE